MSLTSTTNPTNFFQKSIWCPLVFIVNLKDSSYFLEGVTPAYKCEISFDLYGTVPYGTMQNVN